MKSKFYLGAILRLRVFIGVFMIIGVQAVFGQASSYVASTGTGAVLETMNSPQTLIFSASDDVSSAVQNIGFNFAFNGTAFTNFSVNSNGLLRLGNTVVSTAAINILASTNDNPKIAPYWDDLATGTNGLVSYQLIGTTPNRKLTVEWKVTIPKNTGGSAAAIFQCWLFESTNVIQFVYGTGMVSNSANYSVGIASSATDFHSFSTASNTSSNTTVNNSNTSAITSGRWFKYTPAVATTVPNCATAYSPVAGSLGNNPGTTISWTQNGGFPSGYDIYFGTTPTPPLVASNHPFNTYSPGLLNWNTNYYYQIVPRNSIGTAAGCPVIQFKTASLLNYNVTHSTGISFNSISGTGTSIPAGSWRNGTNADDNLSDAINLGFSFNYQEGNYSQVLVSTNGFVTFNTATTVNGSGSTNPYNYANSNLSASGSIASPGILAPFYDDLACQDIPSALQNSIRYATQGSPGSRIFVVEWIGIETYQNPGPNLNFQLRLYEGSNNVEFVYGQMEGFNGTKNHLYSASCGINAISISPTILSSEFFSQQILNTRSFSGTPSNNLNSVPECNTSLLFTPGTYVPYTSTSVPVSNDEYSTTTVLAVNTLPCTELCATYYSSVNATNSGILGCSGTADDDVWFQFTATNPSTTIKVLSSGNYDAVVQLFNSSIQSITCANATGAGFTETISTTNLQQGETYYVRVYHSGSAWGTGSGRFSICINATPLPPVNDECINAINLTVSLNCQSTTGTPTTTATESLNIPTCFATGTVADDDVWYKFTAINSQEVVTVQSSAGFNAVLQVFSGTCNNLTTLQCLNATGSGGTETVTLSNLSIGSVYYIRVYHAASGSGTGNFTICITSPLPACPTNLSPPQATSNVLLSGTTLSWDPVNNANGYKIYMDLVNPPVQLLTTTQNTSVSTGILAAGSSYYWRVEPYNSLGSTTGCATLVFATEPFQHALNIRMFLQAYYKGNQQMVAGIDPVVLDTIADSVTVCLASTTSPFSILYSSKTVLNTSGTATGYFTQPALQRSYYIVVKHRNSIETWSKNSFAFNDPDTTYNFTDLATKAYGNNLIEVEAGVFAIHSGDVNQNGIIDITDLNLIQSSISNFGFGYIPEDLNGDRVVEAADFSFIENKILLNISRLKP